MTKKNLLRFGTLALFAATIVGCKSDKGTLQAQPAVNDVHSCYVNGNDLRDAQADHCCDGAVAKSPYPSDCPVPPGQTAVQDSIQAGVDASQAGLAATAQAGSMESDSSPIKGSQSAAVGASGLESLNPTVANDTPSLAAADPSKSGGAGFGGGGSSSSASGGASGLGGLQTSAATGGTGDAAGMNSAANLAAAGGYGAAGAQRTNGGAGAFGEAFGDLSGSAAGGVSIQDPAERAPAGDPGTMGTVDPDNYFALMDPNESIFKAVEKRYVAKTKQWAMADTARVAKP